MLLILRWRQRKVLVKGLSQPLKMSWSHYYSVDERWTYAQISAHDFWLSTPTLLWKILNRSQRHLEGNNLKSKRQTSPHSWSWIIQPNKARSWPVFSGALIYQFHFSGCAKCLLCFKWWQSNFGRNAKWLLENCGHWKYADNWWKSWFEWFYQWHTGRTINDVCFYVAACVLFSW